MTHSGSTPPADDSSDSLLPPNWAELAPLIDTVLDAPIERRNAVVDELTAGKPELRAELRQLVIDCEREMPLLNSPAAERFADLFNDADEIRLTGVLSGRYQIVREVGRGGMARVFLARDIKHNRDVAVKIVRHDVAASAGSARFLHEIAIAARLRHPNIVPMYDSGEADGVLYFVMPYEEGPSLRERMSHDPPLPTGERISILRDIARALAYAHERGVVHRDVKPDNVLLSGGAAVVSDFGIAKAVSAAQSDTSTGNITQPGARIGTPSYMAPEQAVGDPTTDHRADIYAFGCVAYELFAGKPPFDSGTKHEVIAAHVGATPVSIQDACPGISTSLGMLIMRCLRKLPADRPQSAQELLNELETTHIALPGSLQSNRTLSASGILGVIAVGIILLSAAGYFLARGGKRASALPHEVTVAVLPLINGGDSSETDLAYGLSDEIAAALVKVPGVRVMSRRGVAASRAAPIMDPAKTGRALGAQFLVMSSLRESGGRLKVLASLVQADDGAMLWADQFERSLDDLGAVREEIARSVGDSLQKKSGAPSIAASARPSHVPSSEPYRLYVLAQRALNLRGQSIQASVDNFRKATELDTLFADAFSGLSLALALSPHFKPISSTQVAADAIGAAQHALRLDPGLAQPHVALGIVNSHAYRWDSAGVEFRAGLRLRSQSDVEPLVQYGRYLLFRGRTEEAMKQFLAAQSSEPASALVRSWVAYTYYVQGRMDSAIVENKRAFQSDSTNVTTLAFGVLMLLKSHNVAGARDYVGRIGRYHNSTFYFLGATGDTAGANARIRELEQRRIGPWFIEASRAFNYLGARDTAQAIAAFERATDNHDVWPSADAIQDPVFDPVRSNPRFQRLLHRVGLR